MHECLLNRADMGRSEDLGGYYRIASDNRDLNYSIYFEKGEKGLASSEDYTSGNTHRLSDRELEELLMSLEYIRRELATPEVTVGGHA